LPQKIHFWNWISWQKVILCLLWGDFESCRWLLWSYQSSHGGKQILIYVERYKFWALHNIGMMWLWLWHWFKCYIFVFSIKRLFSIYSYVKYFFFSCNWICKAFSFLFVHLTVLCIENKIEWLKNFSWNCYRSSIQISNKNHCHLSTFSLPLAQCFFSFPSPYDL